MKEISAGVVSSEKEKLPENVKIIERPEARYRIIYEHHGYQHSPEEIGRPDLLVVERFALGGSYENKDEIEARTADFWEETAKKPGGKPQGVISEAEKHLIRNKTPLYFIDVGDPEGFLFSAVKDSLEIKGLENIVAAGALGYVGVKVAKDKIKGKASMTRRDFLKLSGAGVMAAFTGTELLDSLITEYRALGKHYQKNAAERKLQHLREKIHPETTFIMITFRNLLWAEKLQTIAKHYEIMHHRKPEIALMLGAFHSGIENALAEAPEKRLAVIKRFLETFVKKRGLLAITDIAKTEFSDKEKRWIATEIFKDPKLEKIEKSIWPVSTN